MPEPDTIYVEFYAVVTKRQDQQFEGLIIIKDVTKLVTGVYDLVKSSFQSTFTNALSHERLTPLNCILNTSQILL